MRGGLEKAHPSLVLGARDIVYRVVVFIGVEIEGRKARKGLSPLQAKTEVFEGGVCLLFNR